jgi:hypothetical protein
MSSTGEVDARKIDLFEPHQDLCSEELGLYLAHLSTKLHGFGRARKNDSNAFNNQFRSLATVNLIMTSAEQHAKEIL